jgi:ubiquinone/menaquinone biosynthesis C-methylase UbiE
MEGKRVLELGGRGDHAVKFLSAGASEAWLVTPMLGEVLYALALARFCGMEDRLHCVVGVAEALPCTDGSFDAVYAGGCIHHTKTEYAFAECARVLKPGGKFAAIEPWRALLYGIGTAVLGKREPEVHCTPMTKARAQPLFAAFQDAEVIHHGALTRYPLIALWKFGLKAQVSTAWSITKMDDAICSLIPPLRRMGSSIALIGTRGA